MTNVKRNYNKSGNTIVSFTDKVGKKIELVLQDYSLKLKIDGKYKNTIINNVSLAEAQTISETAVKLYAKTYTDDTAVAKTSVTETVTNVETEIPNGPAVHALFNTLVAQNTFLGGIAHDTVAPEPVDSESNPLNGYYEFTSAGSVSYITGGAETVAIGDRLYVTYDGDSYVYVWAANSSNYELQSNKKTTLTDSDTDYPTTRAVNTGNASFYAKSVEMIAHNATAPSPVIPTGTTKTYEFSSGGTCTWLDNQVVEKGDKATVAFTAPSTFVRTFSNNSVIVKFTPEGGLAIRVVNGTGVASVKGSVVSASTTADNRFILQANEFDSIGVVYESGIADGSLCWIVVSGIAEVLLKDTTTATRGQIALSADTDGRMIAIDVPSSNPIVAEHFKEIGHIMESKIAGTDVLVKCMIHFN